MIVQANVVDNDGFIIEPMVVSVYDVLQVNVIKVVVEQGFYTPRWDYENKKWIEGAELDYIERMKVISAISEGLISKEIIDKKIIANEYKSLDERELDFLDIEYGISRLEEKLEYFKEVKVLYFKNKCEYVIEEGFTASNGNFYRTNRDDQTNMIGQKDSLSDNPAILQVPWKTEDKGYIMHSRDEWLMISREAFAHKPNQLFKYDAIKNLTLGVTTLEELNAINW